MKRTAGDHRELHDQFLAARKGNPQCSTMAFVGAVREIEHPEVISSGIVAEEFPDKYPHGWTKQASISCEEAPEAYMVEVIAESHCGKQELISCRFSTCLLPWQGKAVRYSWNSPTCTWP